MTKRYRTAWLLVCGVLFCLLRTTPTAAYFERIVVSSRAFALGGAFVGIADDPSAVVFNAAGLAQIPTTSFLTTVVRPYDISDLEEYYLAAAVPIGIGTAGISWHRFGLDGYNTEDLFSLAFGGDFIRTSQDASFSYGASIDIARVEVGGTYAAAETRVTGSLSLLLRPFQPIGLGYTIRNIGQPSFDFVPGGGATRLEIQQAFGFAYHWRRSFVLLLQVDQGQDDDWRTRFGAEAHAGDHLMFRAGLMEGDVAAGVGLVVSGVTVDIGATSHDVLGMSYLLSVGFRFPQKNGVMQP